MAHQKDKKTHYGDEDPELRKSVDEEEEFEAAKSMGWKPEEMRDKEFAAKYEKWLKQQK